MPAHRMLFWAFILLVGGAVAANFRWGEIWKLGPAAVQTFPATEADTLPLGPPDDQRRALLKQSALAAGRQAMADPCDVDARADYRSALISLGKQRMREIGCSSEYLCNIEEHPYAEVSLAYYATETDRSISRQMHSATEAGALDPTALGVYVAFVGHPKEFRTLNGVPPAALRACVKTGGD